MKPKVLVIVGPTAVGKTSIGIRLAKKFNGEIISGDSMQIYKNLDIGTAKVTKEEAEDIPHYLINEKEIDEAYSVSDFQKQGRELINKITKKKKLPIVVGGTGLYIESLLYDVSHGGNVEPDFQLRKELEAIAENKGNKKLWKKLNDIDTQAAEKIHHNNVRRVVRALEVYYKSGKPYSDFQNERNQKTEQYKSFIIGLNTDRELLYKRINKRVDIMLEQGLEQEARMLYKNVLATAQSSKAIGYKEFFDYFNGQQSYQDTVGSIKQNSRRFAKRQLTWFRNRINVDEWFDLMKTPETARKIEDKVTEFVRK